VDTEQHFENLQQVNELRLKNTELKKELEREQFLHSLLYKDWVKLTKQIADQKQEVYENSTPKNLFYKYAFYVLLICLVPGFYFLYPLTDNNKSSSSQVVSDTARPADSAGTRAAAATNSLSRRDSVSSVQKKQINKRDVTQQSSTGQPVLQPEEKKAITKESIKPAKSITRKHVFEIPLTDDERDSIWSLGFNAYFEHHRNPFRRSSEKYKAWAEGWNDGRAEGKKLYEKDPSLKH
jgi:hypothetical protein